MANSHWLLVYGCWSLVVSPSLLFVSLLLLTDDNLCYFFVFLTMSCRVFPGIGFLDALYFNPEIMSNLVFKME